MDELTASLLSEQEEWGELVLAASMLWLSSPLKTMPTLADCVHKRQQRDGKGQPLWGRASARAQLFLPEQTVTKHKYCLHFLLFNPDSEGPEWV